MAEYPIERRLKWAAPEGGGAPLLTMPNIPKPLHGCLEPDAEVLTKNGWVPIKDVKIGERILCWDDGKVFFDSVLDTVSNEYSCAYKIGFDKATNFDMVYSPDHRLPLLYKELYRGVKKTRREKPKWNFFIRTAEEFKCGGTHTYFITAAEAEHVQNDILTPEERLAIAIQADGSMKRDNKYDRTYVIMLKKKRKIERLMDILRTSSCKYTVNAWRDKTIFHVRTEQKDYKKLSTCFDLPSLSFEKARSIIEESTYWDGYNGKSQYGTNLKNYSSTDRDNIDFMQAVAVMAGYTTSTQCRKKDECKTCWTIWFTDKKVRGCGKIKKDLVAHSGRMYCVTVPSSFFVVRYHDAVVITGNCNPRTIMGEVAWTKARKRAYYNAGYKSEISGIISATPGSLHAHEVYDINYVTGECTFKRICAITPMEHVYFIHSGRMLTLWKNKNPLYTTKKVLEGVENGFKLINEWNKTHHRNQKLKAYQTFLEYLKQDELRGPMEKLIEKYDIEFWGEDEKRMCDWGDWKLMIVKEGRKPEVYPTPYPDYAAWEEAMKTASANDTIRQINNPFKGGAFDEIENLLK